MPLDVDKIREQAANVAGAAAEAANSIAADAKPVTERAAAKIDELAEKGRPYVERAEKAVQDAVNDLRHGPGGGGAF